jgi:hypothetical protein
MTLQLTGRRGSRQRGCGQLLAAETAGQVRRFSGWTEFADSTFVVESVRPIDVGIDGEAMLLDPPLVFRCLAGAVRVRLPTPAPGYSPAALARWWTLVALFRTVAGGPTLIDDAQR